MKTTFCFCCGINQGRLIFKGANSDDHLPKKQNEYFRHQKHSKCGFGCFGTFWNSLKLIETHILFLLWNRAE